MPSLYSLVVQTWPRKGSVGLNTDQKKLPKFKSKDRKRMKIIHGNKTLKSCEKILKDVT